MLENSKSNYDNEKILCKKKTHLEIESPMQINSKINNNNLMNNLQNNINLALMASRAGTLKIN